MDRFATPFQLIGIAIFLLVVGIFIFVFGFEVVLENVTLAVLSVPPFLYFVYVHPRVWMFLGPYIGTLSFVIAYVLTGMVFANWTIYVAVPFARFLFH